MIPPPQESPPSKSQPFEQSYDMALLMLASIGCGLAGFGTAAILNGLLDFEVIGDGVWLQKQMVDFVIGYGGFHWPIGIFVHSFLSWVGYNFALALFTLFADRRALENRGVWFVFLSCIFFQIPTLLYLQFAWATIGWKHYDIHLTQVLTTFPFFGSIVYALQLAVFGLMAKCKRMQPWTYLPWWSIFSPTACFLIANIVLLPVYMTHNFLVDF